MGTNVDTYTIQIIIIKRKTTVTEEGVQVGQKEIRDKGGYQKQEQVAQIIPTQETERFPTRETKKE